MFDKAIVLPLLLVNAFSERTTLTEAVRFGSGDKYKPAGNDVANIISITVGAFVALFLTITMLRLCARSRRSGRPIALPVHEPLTVDEEAMEAPACSRAHLIKKIKDYVVLGLPFAPMAFGAMYTSDLLGKKAIGEKAAVVCSSLAGAVYAYGNAKLHGLHVPDKKSCREIFSDWCKSPGAFWDSLRIFAGNFFDGYFNAEVFREALSASDNLWWFAFRMVLSSWTALAQSNTEIASMRAREREAANYQGRRCIHKPFLFLTQFVGGHLPSILGFLKALPLIEAWYFRLLIFLVVAWFMRPSFQTFGDMVEPALEELMNATCARAADDEDQTASAHTHLRAGNTQPSDAAAFIEHVKDGGAVVSVGSGKATAAATVAVPAAPSVNGKNGALHLAP
jgi:hypothetical protein